MKRTADRVITEQTGAALILVVAVLMIVTGLVAAAIAVAVQTNGSSRRDADKKNALEAAEAGLQVANYRINMLQPDGTHCVGDGVGVPNSMGMCSSSTTSLGNGTTYSYYTTVPIGPGTSFPNTTCVGLNITSDQALNQRCITAVGTANGVTARSQIRIAAFAGTPYFPIPGITGWKSLFFKGGTNTDIQAVAASNFSVTQNNGSNVQGVLLGPPGVFTNGNQFPAPPVTYQDHPMTLSAVPPTTSAINTTSPNSCTPPSQPPPPTWVQTNCDYLLQNGTDQSSGFAFDPTNRILKTTRNNATLTLHGSIYNFCEFDATNNATITLTQKTVIYIDSPYDPNSGVANSSSNPPCKANNGGAGNLNLSNNVTWNNVFADPQALQLYIYGDPAAPATTFVNFNNNSVFWGVLDAPYSALTLGQSTNSSFHGAVTGYTVNTGNDYHFFWDGRAGQIGGNVTGTFYRTAWAQCVPTAPVSSDPGSGCG